MNLHDGSYKTIFSYPQVVKALLQGFVHQDWVNELDFDSLEKTNSHYVSDDLRERSDDLIWKAHWKDNDVYIYLLLEFQSNHDYFMAVRITTYVSLLYQDLIKSKQVKKGKPLPLVLPIVLHRGDRIWKCPLNMSELITKTSSDLAQYTPSLRYLLIDVAVYKEQELEAVNNIVATLFQLENSTVDSDVIGLIKKLYFWVKNDNTDLERALKSWVEFVLRHKLEGVEWQEAKTLGEVATMLAKNRIPWTQQWKEQGLKEGIEKGIEKGVKNGTINVITLLLKIRFGELPEWAISKLNQASVKELEVWVLNTQNAVTLEDVFK